MLLSSTTSAERPLEIALLNNLGDGGLETGDQQIIDLLTRAAGAVPLRLHFFTLPSIKRGPKAKSYIAKRYEAFETLKQTPLDGLFITGCEPKTAHLPDEAFWHDLTGVIDWAEHHTRSTIFSCLAAHAAVLHMDGLARRRLPAKRSGLFEVKLTSAHPLLAGAATTLHVAHSRYNDLDAMELEAAGYEILTEGPLAGVDTFVKRWRSLFVYLQGHPEYDRDALRREYRRDVVRYLDGTSAAYPHLPYAYFEPSLERALDRFAQKAQRDRSLVTPSNFPLSQSGGLRPTLSDGLALTLFRNWLLYLARAAADQNA